MKNENNNNEEVAEEPQNTEIIEEYEEYDDTETFCDIINDLLVGRDD